VDLDVFQLVLVVLVVFQDVLYPVDVDLDVFLLVDLLVFQVSKVVFEVCLLVNLVVLQLVVVVLDVLLEAVVFQEVRNQPIPVVEREVFLPVFQNVDINAILKSL